MPLIVREGPGSWNPPQLSGHRTPGSIWWRVRSQLSSVTAEHLSARSSKGGTGWTRKLSPVISAKTANAIGKVLAVPSEIRMPSLRYNSTARILSAKEHINYLHGGPSFRPHPPGHFSTAINMQPKESGSGSASTLRYEFIPDDIDRICSHATAGCESHVMFTYNRTRNGDHPAFSKYELAPRKPHAAHFPSSSPVGRGGSAGRRSSETDHGTASTPFAHPDPRSSPCATGGSSACPGYS